MYLFRLIIILLVILLVFYYTMMILQLFDIVKVTKSKLDWKTLIPFYYFIN